MPDARGPRARSAAAAIGERPWRGLGWAELGAAALRLADIRAAALAEADARRLFLWLPVAMGIGIALHFAADATPPPWPAAVLVLICGIAAVRLRARLGWCSAFAALAFVALGFAAAAWRVQAVAAPILDRPVLARITGFVETVDAGPGGGRMVIRLTGMTSATPVTQPQRIRVTIRGAPPPRAGDHVSGQARLMPPPQPAFPGGYDFARDAYFLGLGAVGRWIGPISLAPPPHAAPMGLRWTAAIDNARTDLTARIAGLIGGQAGALSAALVTGKRGLIEETVNEHMRAAGIYHIVSISGLHMVLAAGVFFWLARAGLALLPGVAETRPIKKWAAVIAMAGAAAYCVFSGSEVATERSLIMTLTMLGAILVDRPALSMRNLAISALIVLAREPETMLGPSFQMSYAAVAGMIAANDWWIARRAARAEPASWGAIMLRKLWLAVAASLATTLIASIATAPFAAYHFQRLNPYGLIGNALAVPFVSLIVMPAAVAGTLLLPFGLDGPVWQLMGQGSQRVLDVARYVAELQGSVRGSRAFGSGALILMTIGFVVMVIVRAPVRLIGLAPFLAGVWLAAAPRPIDMLIGRDGRHVMMRGLDGRYILVGRSVNRFTTERWLQADGDLRRAADASLRTGSRCDRLGCVAHSADGGAVALTFDIEAFEDDCRRARVVVTPLTAPAFCKTATLVIDRETLAASASLALYRSAQGYHVVPARPYDIWKPWFGRPRHVQQAQAIAPDAETTPEASPEDDGAGLLMP